MNTNRLSKEVEAALNGQMTNEAHAAQVYLSYGCWADEKGYGGISNFLFRHASEERNHMMKILEYILLRGGDVKVVAIPAPGPDPVSVSDCFEKVYKSEIDNTAEIYKIVKLSLDTQDWATWNFMQWFVKEQIEEETLALSLLDNIKIAGGEKAQSDALYNLDRDLKSEADSAKGAEAVTAENP